MEATGTEAIAVLEGLNGEAESLVEGFEPLKVELLPGFAFADIKHGQLMAFYENYDPGLEHSSRFHFNDHVVRAAQAAGWFKRPADFDLSDMEWQDVETLRVAVTTHAHNLINTPKN